MIESKNIKNANNLRPFNEIEEELKFELDNLIEDELNLNCSFDDKKKALPFYTKTWFLALICPFLWGTIVFLILVGFAYKTNNFEIFNRTSYTILAVAVAILAWGWGTFVFYKLPKIKKIMNDQILKKIDLKKIQKIVLEKLYEIKIKPNQLCAALGSDFAVAICPRRSEDILYTKFNLDNSGMINNCQFTIYNWEIAFKDIIKSAVDKKDWEKYSYQTIFQIKTKMFDKKTRFLLKHNLSSTVWKRMFFLTTGLKEEKLENISFSKQWSIFSNNRLDLRMFLTILSQENLLSINTNNLPHFSDLLIYFETNTLYICFNGRLWNEGDIQINSLDKQKVKRVLINNFIQCAKHYHTLFSFMKSFAIFESSN